LTQTDDILPLSRVPPDHRAAGRIRRCNSLDAPTLGAFEAPTDWK